MGILDPVIRIPVSAVRGASQATRAAAKARGLGREYIIAETRGINDATRAAIAAGTPEAQIVAGLRAVNRVARGGRMPQRGSKPDNFLEDAYANADFVGQRMWERKGGYHRPGDALIPPGFGIPRVPQGTLKPDLPVARKKLAAKKAQHKRSA